ncbi:MAG: GGDEF domain-containing protein [Kangiellaceae bacterium]|jgi:diguanylate cyclase (GGDEF)-like protein|nr:GGDEF domain-containing protein [Kangiellaceae bacterium]
MEYSLNRQDEKVLKRNAIDIAKRGLLGVVIYPVYWTFIAVASDFVANHTTIFVISISYFIIGSALRALHIRQVLSDRSRKIHLEKWHFQAIGLVIFQPLGWAVLLIYGLVIGDNQFIQLMAFAVAGIAAGGANSFAPKMLLAYVFTISLLLPPAVAGFFIQDQSNLGILLVTFTVYMFGLARNQNREYWASIESEFALEKQSRTDALTQLDNRRFFDEKLDEFCHLSSRSHEKLTIMLVDCDHFKKVNDNYGHDVGDMALKHLANLLTQTLPRATDVCARYGGEEFSLILPGTDIDGAKIVGERIRTLIASNPISMSGSELALTVSIGSVSRAIDGFYKGLPDELFKQADEALYQAKNSGRNRCVFKTFTNGEYVLSE